MTYPFDTMFNQKSQIKNPEAHNSWNKYYKRLDIKKNHEKKLGSIWSILLFFMNFYKTTKIIEIIKEIGGKQLI
jgi:hypothetical protein